MGDSVVTRFAPSPTGHLHVGGARTALFNWALARGRGRFLLRIEDTDRARSSEDATRGILEDLAWLGVHWDEGPEWRDARDGVVIGGDPRGVGPFHQAERRALYDRHIERLIESDRAYPAFESADRIEAARRAAQAEKRGYRYRRPADWDRAAALERMRREDHVVRFRMPETPVEFVDDVLGALRFGEEHLDDFVIRKRDGFPTYHLAVVVDDALMGVTHVLRGQEHLNNTPRHVALQRSLDFRTPRYAHLPLIFNADGSKMSKRDKDKAARGALRAALAGDPQATRERVDRIVGPDRLERWLSDAKRQLEPRELAALGEALGVDLPGIDVEDFRRAGYLPEVVCNFLALLGWSPGQKDDEGRDIERFDRAFLAERFTTQRIGRANARFDREKLLSFNQSAIAELGDADFFAQWSDWCARYAPDVLERFDEAWRRRFAAAIRTRCRTLADPTARSGPGAFALVADDAFPYDAQAVAKFLHKGEPSGCALLGEVRASLLAAQPFEPASIEAAVRAFCEQRGVGMGRVAQPLRVAATGGAASPPLGDTLALLGRERVARRLERCLAECAPAA
ncbi:MAG: glutamate--tRNA ligase [Myxococcales bacterium]|nr:glutamate--tRNA ligase [Myxococcales bacterium]MDH5565539.1 glutamate--tRNA ligase [Myxococcales bacterium]